MAKVLEAAHRRLLLCRHAGPARYLQGQLRHLSAVWRQLEGRLRQTVRAEGISFQEAIRRPRNLLVGMPVQIADHMQDMYERTRATALC